MDSSTNIVELGAVGPPPRRPAGRGRRTRPGTGAASRSARPRTRRRYAVHRDPRGRLDGRAVAEGERPGVRHLDGPLDAGVVAADVEGSDIQGDVGERLVALTELFDQLLQRSRGQGGCLRVHVLGQQGAQGVVIAVDPARRARPRLAALLVRGHRASTRLSLQRTRRRSTHRVRASPQAPRGRRSDLAGEGIGRGDATAGLEPLLQLPVVGGLPRAVRATRRASRSVGGGTGTASSGSHRKPGAHRVGAYDRLRAARPPDQRRRHDSVLPGHPGALEQPRSPWVGDGVATSPRPA